MIIQNHSHAAVEVHAVDTNRLIVLDSQIDVLANPEAKVARLRKVLLLQLVFLDLQSTLKNFLCLRTTDGDMYGDLFVSSNTESSDCVSSFAYSSKFR